MTTRSSHASWRAATLDVLWRLRLVLWAAIFIAVWFALFSPALAQPQPFPWPPPNTGCPPNTSCIPGGFPGGGNPGQCTPNPNGDPGCNGAGNPVDIITGNKYQSEIDLAPLPGELGIHFSRHYNSNSTHRGLTGVGWRSTYEVVLVDLGSALQIIDADGRRLTFGRNAQQPTLCVSADSQDGRVIIDEGTDRPRQFRWQRLDGSEYTFFGGTGDGHPLQSMRAASGATVTLNYLGGALDHVRDPNGRVLRFVYSRPQTAGSSRYRTLTLTAIETPLGRVSYTYDENGRLLSASKPSGQVHRFHYESERQGSSNHSWALTGISVEWMHEGKVNAQRLATYAYDARGRAVRTQHVGGDDLTLAYGPKAQTTVTTAAGARTVYRHALVAGQWKTVEGIGPGCASCPTSNVRYRYLTQGARAGELEATLYLDNNGGPARIERLISDGIGRPIRFEQVRYAGGKAQPPLVAFRAEYAPASADALTSHTSASEFAALWLPRVVARPSIVTGVEHAVAVSYNAQLQPLTVTEAGASPIDAAGAFVPTPVTRTTSYRYAHIAGASRAIAIDGPLPGSADTTTLHYDELGRLRVVQHPAPDLQERFAYDEAGRVVWHQPVDAVPVRTMFDASGEPAAWQRGEARVAVTRDARGRPLRIEMLDGEVRWIGHDGPGSLGAEVSNRGWGRWRVRTLQAAQHLAQTRASAFTPELAPKSTSVDLGSRVNGVASEWGDISTFRDDFGRLVAQRTAFTGLEVRRYDEANRLLERRFADGGTWRYKRDAAGRILAHTVAAPAADTVTTRLQWYGAYVIRVEHPNEIEDRRFDAMGRLAERSLARPAGLQLLERFNYDAADRLTRHELPEGGALRYAWGIGKRIQRIDYESALGHVQTLIEPLPTSGALGSPLPGKPLRTTTTDTSNAVATPAPVRGGYRFGNGIEARWHLDARGQLAALEHRATAVSNTQASWWDRLFAWIPAAHADAAAPLIAGWRYGFDEQRRMALRTDANIGSDTTFGYDRQSRLVAAQPGTNSDAALEYYAYDALGNTLGRRTGGNDQDFRQVAIERNAGGLPRRIGDRELKYSADRRLVEVMEAGRSIAAYSHNTHGERIGKGTAHGATHYLYWQQRLAAETLPDQPTRLARRYVYADGVPVAVLDYPHGQALAALSAASGGYGTRAVSLIRQIADSAAGRTARVGYVHANEIGAPVTVTDLAQRVQWRAAYRVYGEADVAKAPASSDAVTNVFALNLRLPGQYWDAETGWHDNYLRTYDPARGQYLESDPLGPIRGLISTQPFGYVNHNPLIYADPLGLILFAFDGTGNNSNLNSINRDFTNVWWMREYYDRSARGQDQAFYQRGIGTDPNAWDITNIIQQGIATQGHDFVREQLDNLSNYLRGLGAQSQTIPIDIIGFSRGAALARDFANQVLRNYRAGNYGSHCLDFRFLGLFDTVSQFGLLGARDHEYDFTIASEWRSVAQAYALNEHRATFPLRSIGRGVERGFVGAHSDVGGGYNVAGESHPGDLSDVALNWMVQQATLAGVVFRELPEELRRVDQPVVHDQRNTSPFYGDRYETPILDPFGIPIDVTPPDERLVFLPGGTTMTQRSFGGVDPQYGSLMEGIIQRPPRWEYRRDNCAGQVDMAAYRRWLQANYGVTLLASPGEGTSTPCS